MEFESVIKKNLWIFFQKYGFIRKIEPFDLRMKHNIIQMTASACLVVPHSINPIFQYIFDFFGQKVNKVNAKLLHLGLRKSKRHYWEAEAPTTSDWCGFWYGDIIGPFFFENEQGAAVTANGERYRAMLNEFLLPKIEEDDMDDIWFQYSQFKLQMLDSSPCI